MTEFDHHNFGDAPSPPDHAPAPRRVLLADDQPHVLLTLKHLIQRIQGLEVITADEGNLAFTIATEQKPDLCIIDVVMPGLDGYTACRTIREKWGSHHGQIWLMTGRLTSFDQDQASVVGADRFIGKPVDPDSLTHLVADTLGLTPPRNLRNAM